MLPKVDQNVIRLHNREKNIIKYLRIVKSRYFYHKINYN